MNAATPRGTDEYGREIYRDSEIPPPTARFARWRGLLTHPDASTRGNSYGQHRCIGGWVRSGGWWLHCAHCRPDDAEVSR